jgi:hypothetical protein
MTDAQIAALLHARRTLSDSIESLWRGARLCDERGFSAAGTALDERLRELVAHRRAIDELLPLSGTVTPQDKAA